MRPFGVLEERVSGKRDKAGSHMSSHPAGALLARHRCQGLRRKLLVDGSTALFTANNTGFSPEIHSVGKGISLFDAAR